MFTLLYIFQLRMTLTVVRYIERFPGLIHFIYVNRRTNQVMAPALNITHDNSNTTQDATQLLKDKVCHNFKFQLFSVFVCLFLNSILFMNIII